MVECWYRYCGTLKAAVYKVNFMYTGGGPYPVVQKLDEEQFRLAKSTNPERER